MHHDGFNVATDTLKNASAAFRRLSQELQQAEAALQAALAGCAGMEGNDEYGALFRQYYEPATSRIRAVLGWTIEGLDSIGQGLAAQSDNYTTSDGDSSARLRGLRLGGP